MAFLDDDVARAELVDRASSGEQRMSGRAEQTMREGAERFIPVRVSARARALGKWLVRFALQCGRAPVESDREHAHHEDSDDGDEKGNHRVSILRLWQLFYETIQNRASLCGCLFQ